MKRIAATAAALAVLLSASMATGQGDASPESQSKLKDAMGWMIGEWEGKFASDDRPVNEKIEWTLDRKFIRRTTTFAAKDGKQWTRMIMVTWDQPKGVFKHWGFDSFGGVGTAVSTPPQGATSVSWEVDLIRGDRTIDLKATWTKVDGDTFHETWVWVTDATETVVLKRK